ncbi:MAG TPA: AMP-binding protein, partial [Mycobacterium sp.]|nr:AMP-binding protein [Mycobacterium sp.]
MTSYQWNPTPEGIEQANVTRLARSHDLAGIDELRARSVADTAWYWDAAAADLGLRFRTPYSRVLDLHNGIEHPDWFVDATMNIVDSCLLRWRDETPDRIAVVHEDEAGRIREITFSELATEVARAANGLRELGIGPGDAVAIYLPMIPEAVVACYAVAALGAILVPLFSG